MGVVAHNTRILNDRLVLGMCVCVCTVIHKSRNRKLPTPFTRNCPISIHDITWGNISRSTSQLLKPCLSSKTPRIRTTIFPHVLYHYLTRSLTLRKERKLQVFGTIVFRKTFGPKKAILSNLRYGKRRHFIYAGNLILLGYWNLRWVGHVAGI